MESKRPNAIGGSFQFKLFLIFTILSFFTACAFITLHALDKISETRGHAGKELRLRARQLAESIRLPLYAEDGEILRDVAQRTGQVPGICRVVIKAADGRVLADYRTGAAPVGPIAETVPVLTLPETVSGLGVGQGGAPTRIGSVHLERTTDDLKRAIHRDIGYSCLIALAFWVAVSGLSFLVLRRMTRSFEALVRGVEAMQEGDYASRIPIVCGDEPGRVAQAINALAGSLQQRDEENLNLTEELLASFKTEVRAREELILVNHTLEQENLERVQAEQAARASEQTLRTMMDIMPVGVVLARQDGSVEYVNQFLVDSFGYGREQIPTLDAWFARMEVQREATQSGDREGGDAKPYDARVTCKGGRVRNVLLSTQVQGERTILLVIDITDRELMQEQLNKVQKLESLGVLAGGIAHNFNNALTGVLGFISLTRCTLEPSHGAHRYLQLAEKASLRAAGMAKQLLTFAKGGAPVKKSVSLAKLVEEVVALTLNGSNVRCRVELPAALPPVKADEGQMVQALSNIVINAMQAMPGGGEITVRAELERSCCPKASHDDGVRYVSLTIADEGNGIAPEHLPKIFDPYFSTKETTGLGLASVHSIIYRHGGHVSVASELGKGTVFTVCLPAAKSSASVGSAERNQDGQGAAGGTVLVMDDDATIRELSAKMLGFLGYRAVPCADGREAVELYRTSHEAGTPFKAAILDLTVPGGMGGVEAAREILAADPQANLIVSSGYSYDPVMAQYRKYGFCGAVAKPYRADELSHELGLIS